MSNFDDLVSEPPEETPNFDPNSGEQEGYQGNFQGGDPNSMSGSGLNADGSYGNAWDSLKSYLGQGKDALSAYKTLQQLFGGGRGGQRTGNYQFPAGDALGGLLEFLGRNRQAGQLNSAANNAANRADPFGGQRGFYQDELRKSYTDPNYFTNSPVFKGLNDYALNATNAKMAAGGYNMSGNQMDQLTQTAARTGYQYALPEQQLLGGFAGSQFNPAVAGQLQLQGQTAGINAGLGAQGALGNLFNTVNEGQQPDIISRLFGGQSGNKTLAQTIGLS